MNAFGKILRNRFFIAGYLAILLSACSGSSKVTTITENDVREIMQDVEKASSNRDIDRVAKYLAPSVVITIEEQTPAGPMRMQMNRDQYISTLREVFSKTSEYEYRQENAVITIGSTGRTATVEADIFEHIVFQGVEKKTMTREKAQLELIDGKILLTSLEGSVRESD